MTAKTTVRLTDKVTAGLLAMIAEDGLVPGDKLPTAHELCQRFGVSRTVVRESIASLQAEGRLRSLRGSGVYVHAPERPSETPGLLISGAANDVAELLDFMELRISVEVEAARLAAQRRSETDVLRIQQAMAAFSRHSVDKSLASDADRALHVAIAQSTGNPKFKQFVDEMGERLIPRRALGAAFAHAEEQAAFLAKIDAEHRALVDAIVERDAEAAAQAMRVHLDNGRRRYRTWNLGRHEAKPHRDNNDRIL